MKRGFHILFVIPVVAAAFLLCQQVQGQIRKIENLPKYDRAIVHFGFALGINVSNFKMQPVEDLRIRDTVYAITPRPVTGLNLGIISNLRLGEHFDLRFIPALTFVQRNLEYNLVYTDLKREKIIKRVESTYLEFPLDFKFKSRRIHNYRIYVLAGGKYAIDMVSQAKVLSKDKEIVKLEKRDWGYEIGVGVDFYLTYFKFAPELKMFNGLTNLLVQDDRTFSRPLKSLSSKTFVLSFTFE